MLNIDNYKNYIWNIEDETKLKNFINEYNEKLNIVNNKKMEKLYTKIIDQIIKVIIYNDITFEYITQKIINNPFDYKYLTLINDLCEIMFINIPKNFLDKAFETIDKKYINEP